MQRLPAVFLLAIPRVMAGCATGPDCRSATARGTELASRGLPAEADRNEIPAACRDAFRAAWTKAAAEYCRPAHGFAIGHSDAVYYGICKDAEFQRHYRLGRTLWVLEVEQENLKAIAAATDDETERARIRARLRVLARDIPELETLARLQGLMPPAQAPED